MSEAPAAAIEPSAAAGRGGGGAVRRDEVERRAERRHDNPALRAPASSLIGGHAPVLVPASAPALVPVHAPALVAVPAKPAIAKPAVAEEEVGLEEGSDEERGRESVARGAVAIPQPPPPGGAGARLQRTSLPELFVAMVTPDRDEAGGLLVEDDAQTLTSGQMRKGDFMRQLRTEVCRVAEEELRRAGRSAAGCPYIDEMLSYYEGKSAEHLERAIRRYAPETRRVRDARDYLPILAARLGHGIARWATTGQMPEDVPNEALAALAGARNGIVGAIAGIAGLSRKAAAGAEPATVDAGALVRQLGPGQALDGGTQARMERALGHSFAGVRIHADDRAAALSHDLAARAFTIGPHVAFGPGELQPGTPHGDALLAHELAHVIQQGTAAPHGDVPLGAAADPLERDADDAALAAVAALHSPAPGQLDEDDAAAGRVVAPRRRGSLLSGGLRLQRCPPTPQPRLPEPPRVARRVLRTESTPFGTYSIINDGVGLMDRQQNDLTEAELTRARAAWTRITAGEGGLVITGSRDEFIALLAREMPRSRTLRALVIEIVEDTAHPVPIVAGRDNALWVDKFDTNTLDLRDLEFYEDEPSPGFESVETRGEALVHVLSERRFRATSGEARWQPAHLHALREGGEQERYRRDRGGTGRSEHHDPDIDEVNRTIVHRNPDTAGNETVFRLDASAAGDPVPYEMEYRPAGLAAGTRGSVRQNMMTARLTAGGARPRNLFVRFHGMRNHADTSVAAVSSGSPQAVETALGGIVPAGERISVELYRRDSAGDTLVTTVDWPHPFNVTAAVRTVGGVRYGITLELVRR